MLFSYSLVTTFDGKNVAVNRSDGWSIPFDPANTDYAKFKTDLSEGATLLDADGNTMSPEQIAEFVATLP